MRLRWRRVSRFDRLRLSIGWESRNRYGSVEADLLLPPSSGHSGLRARPFVWESIGDFVEVLAVREATIKIIQIQRNGTTLPISPRYCLLHRNSFKRIIVYGQGRIALRSLVGIITTVVVFYRFNNRVDLAPAVWTGALIYDVPQHSWFVALQQLNVTSASGGKPPHRNDVVDLRSTPVSL